MSDAQVRPISWKLRKWFWNRIATLKFGANKPADIQVRGGMVREIKAVPLVSQFPGIPIPNIHVADYVPPDEAKPLIYLFYKFQVALYRYYPAMQPGLPEIDPDPEKALNEAYTASHWKYFPPPVLPPEYNGENKPDLGVLAAAGPYASYLEQTPDGDYQWDLRDLGNYEHHEGLHSLGVRVRFRVDRSNRSLQAYQIESELGKHTPTDLEWPLAVKIALCAVSTHVSLVRHFNWVHLASGAQLAIATRNCLPKDHALCRLLWPHIYGTQYSNQMVTLGQMAAGGDFDSIFSFTHRGMCKLFEHSYEKFTIVVNDPERDAAKRGITSDEFETLSLINQREIFDVMHEHAKRYIGVYYDTDEALRQDEHVQNWLAQLDKITPNGIGDVVGDNVTLKNLARLIASYIYLVTVQHELLGSFMWNYQMWLHKQPVRVYKDGRREPLDVYQRLVNANFNLNVNRKKLMDDFSYLAIDPNGADVFKAFRQALQALQGKMEQEPFAYWKIYPQMLNTNMNA
jgi:hypothetical protein